MIGGGEFIINGAERVVVSQLHRSPGVDFVVEPRGRQGPALLPHHPRARQLDRDQRHQEGHARRPHRPVGQVLGDDAAAGDGPGVLDHRRASSRSSTEPEKVKLKDPDARAPAGRRPGEEHPADDRRRRRHRPGDRRSLPRRRQAVHRTTTVDKIVASHAQGSRRPCRTRRTRSSSNSLKEDGDRHRTRRRC